MQCFYPHSSSRGSAPGGRTLRLAQRTLRLTGFAVPTKQKSWRAAWILLDTPYTWAVAAGHLWQITIEI